MRLSPPSSKKFDSLPTAGIEQLLPHRRHGALRFGGRFGTGRMRTGQLRGRCRPRPFDRPSRSRSRQARLGQRHVMGDEVGGRSPATRDSTPAGSTSAPSSATTNACTTERSRSPATTATAFARGIRPRRPRPRPAPPCGRVSSPAAGNPCDRGTPRRLRQVAASVPVRYQRPSSTKEAAVFPDRPDTRRPGSPADPQLAGHPVGAVEAVLAHDAEGLVGEGSAVGDRAPRRIDLPDLEVVRPYAGLGRAAHGHEQHPLGQLRAQTQRHPVAGDEGQPQTGRGQGRRRASRPAGRGPSSTPSRPGRASSRHADACAALLLVGQHDGGSEREAEDVERGEVEVKGRHAQGRSPAPCPIGARHRRWCSTRRRGSPPPLRHPVEPDV